MASSKESWPLSAAKVADPFARPILRSQAAILLGFLGLPIKISEKNPLYLGTAKRTADFRGAEKRNTVPNFNPGRNVRVGYTR